MNKKYSILALSSWFPNQIDPQQGVFVQQQINAIQKNHEITHLIVQRGVENKIEETKHGNLTTIKFTYKDYNSFLKPAQWILAWRKAISFVKNKPFHFIHLHVIYPVGIAAIIAQKKLNIPLIVTEHWSGYISQKEYFGVFRKWVTKKIIQNSKAVIVQSNFLKTNMENIGLKGKYFVIPNLVRFSPSPIIFNENSVSIKILNVADHIDSNKNISGYLNAIKICLGQNKNLKFTQIGGGADTTYLKNLATKLPVNKNLIWKGRLLNHEVLEEIKLCDFGVINSNIETFSIVAFEFLAAGKPIIITQCGGPEEYLPEGFGISVPTNNCIELAKAILTMSKTFKSFPSEIFSKKIRNEFSEEKFLFRINAFYQDLIK